MIFPQLNYYAKPSRNEIVSPTLHYEKQEKYKEKY